MREIEVQVVNCLDMNKQGYKEERIREKPILLNENIVVSSVFSL